MHQNSLANLKPWQPGQSGNSAGRKIGSKNISTLVRELLEQHVDSRFPLNKDLKELIVNNNTTYAKAIVYAMLLRAMEGDVRAAIYLTELQAIDELRNSEIGLFSASKIQVEIVKSNRSAQN